ncbi:MAG: DUF3488 and DUF4129 domain-containing transglutaminase family protein [Pseudomonadota bacterium]|nr:DUF3488 and DUF4129 domain-containing transglutaminase family protein [Pseudomonadota bacterium]
MARRTPTPLTPRQVRWLGALLLAVQLPQAYYMPLWVSIVGPSLVIFRIVLQGRAVAQRERVLARLPAYVLSLFALGTGIAVRAQYGEFLGRDPCVAFLFVLVGIKFLEARTVRDGTLLVCLASFLMVTPFFYNQSLLAGFAAVPGLLMLASCLQLLAPPGHMKRELEWRDPLRRSARLLIEGVPLAILLFVLFPRLSAPLWGLPSDFSAKTGLSNRMHPGSISELSLSDAVAFRVDFAGAIPQSRLRYWRGPVLTQFDGEEWSPSVPTREGRPMRLRGAPLVFYTVTLEPHFKRWLFALDLPASLPKRLDSTLIGEPPDIGMLTPDQQLLAPSPVSQPLRYSQMSQLQDAFASGVDVDPEVERAENLQLAEGSPRTRELAVRLRTEHPGDADFARAVLAWFGTQPFYYTLSPPRLPSNVTDRFLFDTRRGFCEHYASAFVVLLRSAGIPARVVTGYQGGEVNPNGGYLIVRQSDAHAWAEALIDGQWRRFDPTAAVAPSRIELGLGGALPADDRVPYFARQEGWFKQAQLAWDALNYDWRRYIVGFNSAQQQSLWRFLGLDQWLPWQIALGVSIFTGLWAAGLLLWFRLRQRQRDDRIATLWSSLCTRLARAGLPRAQHEGPLAYATRAAERWPAFAAAFAVIGDSYAEVRYGPSPANVTAGERAIARLRHAIAVLPRARTLRNSAAV